MYKLHIANKNYSSWSLRPWVLMKQLDIAFEESLVPFVEGSNREQFRHFSPNGLVPCLEHDQVVVWDSLAITEYLAEHHAVWPVALNARTWARCASAEMHSGFGALRNQCPMSCGTCIQLHAIDDALQCDINRLDELLSEGLSVFGGPYLAGRDYSAVDAFYAPVAFRVRSFALSLSTPVADYFQRVLDLDSMREWDTVAVSETFREAGHEQELASIGKMLEDRRQDSRTPQSRE